MALQIYQFRRLGELSDLELGDERQILTVVANSLPEAEAIIDQEVASSRLSEGEDPWVHIPHTGGTNNWIGKPGESELGGTSYEASVPGVVSLLNILVPD